MLNSKSVGRAGTLASVVVAGLLLLMGVNRVNAQWLQWGGPNRNFKSESKGLAEKWPTDGPKKLWSRDLGEGYSTILVDGGTLYTMYRSGDDEFVLALESNSGKTLWERKNEAAPVKLMNEWGPGPHSTPLIIGDRLFAVGSKGLFQCLDKKTGNVHWSLDLHEKFGMEIPEYGYSCSPIAYKNTIILQVGGADGQSLVAFDQDSGNVVWKNQKFKVTYSSPILIKFGGEDQLVSFMGEEVVGLNPSNGDLLWSHPHKTQYEANIATPVWDGDDLILTSAAYDSGTRAVRLLKEGDKTVAKEVWYNRKLRVHHASMVRIGDYLYASSGDFGPAFLMAVNAKTGEVAWRERGFARANVLFADGKLIVLDEDGQLAMVKAAPESFGLLSKVQLLSKTAWTAPTLVGTKLYVRDRKSLMALELG